MRASLWAWIVTLSIGWSVKLSKSKILDNKMPILVHKIFVKYMHYNYTCSSPKYSISCVIVLRTMSIQFHLVFGLHLDNQVNKIEETHGDFVYIFNNYGNIYWHFDIVKYYIVKATNWSNVTTNKQKAVIVIFDKNMTN